MFGGTGTGTDNLSGGTGNDTIFANGGNDTVDGGSGDDSLFGGDGVDNITGGAGNDTIFGGAGNDVIDGGAGNDTFSFVTGFGSDTINNFGTTANTNTDVLDLSEIGGLTLNGLLASATFVTGTGAGARIAVGDNDSIFLAGAQFDTVGELTAIFNNGQVLV
nr:calcium-binding protein [Kordiimonas aquimaris]